MSDFLDNAFDSDTMAVQAKIEKIKKYLFVEGLDDVEFWSELLKNNDIEISSTSREDKHKSKKGKNILRKLIEKTNKNFIIAIDSDFDFLCQNNSQSSIDFNSCQYVIQTYFYSKENITLQPNIVDLNLSKTKINNEKISSDFKLYIEEYSKTIYKCFVKFLFLRDMRIKPISSKDFHSKLTPQTPIFDISYMLRNDPLINIKKNIIEIEKKLDEKIMDLHDGEIKLDKFTEEINDKGLFENNAYCFIKGHIYEDSIVNPYVDGKLRALKKRLMIKIREECKSKPTQISDKYNEISNILNKYNSFHTRVNDCQEKYDHEIIKKITNDYIECTT